MDLENKFRFQFCFVEYITAAVALDLILPSVSIFLFVALAVVILLNQVYCNRIKRLSTAMKNLLSKIQIAQICQKKQNELKRIQIFKKIWNNNLYEIREQVKDIQHLIYKKNLDITSKIYKNLHFKLCPLQNQLKGQSFSQNLLHQLIILAKIKKSISINWKIVSFVRIDIKIKILINLQELIQQCQQINKTSLFQMQNKQNNFIFPLKYQKLIKDIKQQLFQMNAQKQNKSIKILQQINQIQHWMLFDQNKKEISNQSFDNDDRNRSILNFNSIKVQRKNKKLQQQEENLVNYNKQEFKKDLDLLLLKRWHQNQKTYQMDTQQQSQNFKMLEMKVTYNSSKKQYLIQQEKEKGDQEKQIEINK